jgi:2-amino-4-hydroxy-6-hydroxymethyldihydropteridine diphosphokinase
MYLARRIDALHTVYMSREIGPKKSSTRFFRHTTVLGVGGNVGDVRRRFDHLWTHLERLPQVAPIKRGVILKNPPFGYTQQADFYNTVFEIATSLRPRELLRLVWRIEHRYGRVRSFPNAPRTLDLDILFFDDIKINYPELTIPHPSWKQRVSVTIPLDSIKRTFRRQYENLNL